MNDFSPARVQKGVIGLQILLWALLLMYINSIYARGLIACDRQRRNALVIGTVTTVNIVLNLILIPRFGLGGAAFATVAAEAVALLFYYREFGKMIKTKVYSYLPRPLLASLIMVIFLRFFASGNIFLLIPGGACIYLVSLYLVKGITREELRLAREIIKC